MVIKEATLVSWDPINRCPKEKIVFIDLETGKVVPNEKAEENY